jgi:hypothetical protein
MVKYFQDNYVSEDNVRIPPTAEFQPSYGANCLEDLFGPHIPHHKLRKQRRMEAMLAGAVTATDFRAHGLLPMTYNELNR